MTCGTRKKLGARSLDSDVHPGASRLGLLLLGGVILLVVSDLVRAGVERWRRPTTQREILTYFICGPCARRARSVRELRPVGILLMGVGVLATLTAGFNGAPILAAGIFTFSFFATTAFFVVLFGKGGLRASRRPDGIALEGVHRTVADRLLADRVIEDRPGGGEVDRP